MYQSRKFFFPLLMAIAFLCGCGQNEDLTTRDGNDDGSQENVNVVFRLQSNTSNATRSVEDSYNHVQGTPEEYKVNSVRVYLFDNATRLFAKSFSLTGIKFAGTDTGGNVIYDTDPISVPQGKYDIFVTANTSRQIDKKNEDEFLADIDNATYAQALIEDISGGVVMTNRASANLAVDITKAKNTDVNTINITLERVLARLDIAKASETYEVTDNKGAKYASVKLDGYFIVNLPKSFYTYRHTAVLTTLAEPEWTVPTNFGNVSDVNGYVIDPYFFKKTIDASGFTNSDKYYQNFAPEYGNADNVKWNAFNAAKQTPEYKTAYCLENCALAPAQKNGYSTGVLFRAVMEPNNNVYHLGTSGNMELVTDKSKYPETLYYFNQKFYDSAEALSAAVVAAGTATGQFQSRKFEKTDAGYRCYYKYWIRHQDNNNPTEMGVMEFGVVRNNLYRMLITGISDLGEGTPEIVPDTPDEGETYLQVILNVKPWIVRDLTNIVL